MSSWSGTPSRFTPSSSAVSPQRSSDSVKTIFAFLGLKTAFAKLEAAGFTPTIVASEVQSFPRIGYERLEHIRAVDAEASVPAGMPVTVERFVILGAASE